MPNKILIVDDDADFRSELRDILGGYEIIEAQSGEEALRILRSANEIGMVLLDVNMPGVSGIDILTEIKKTDPNKGIIILTGYGSKEVAVDALKGHADDYIEKPLDIEKMNEIIEKVLEIKRQEKDTDIGGINGKIEKVKRFVEMNCYKKTTLKDAAAVVYLSPKYLSRIFKQGTRMSFSRYRLQVKIDRSKELLQKSDYNVSHISDKLGYENAESFIRQFKKFTGKTPTQYRKKIQREKEKKHIRR